MPSTEGNLRPVDLARTASISTQQVRNYEAVGILPPAARTASGYRRYRGRHRDALLTYRALAAGHGSATAQQGDAPPLPGRDMQIGEAAARVGVRPSALRVWEAAGLLHPSRQPATGYRRYGPGHLRDIRVIHLLRQSHYRFDDIRPILDDLRLAGDTTALSAALDRRRAELHHRATDMLHGAGLLHSYIDAHLSNYSGEPLG